MILIEEFKVFVVIKFNVRASCFELCAPYQIDYVESAIRHVTFFADWTFTFVSDGSESESAGLTEKKKTGPPANTTTYTVSRLKRPCIFKSYLYFTYKDLER